MDIKTIQDRVSKIQFMHKNDKIYQDEVSSEIFDFYEEFIEYIFMNYNCELSTKAQEILKVTEFYHK